jgi:3-deoxy-manno-octulosonate cytidylyltransferase (CMP-KDO synthetase)
MVDMQIKRNFSVLGVIPARYKSTRFEGKPLVKIAGIPMIKRTYTQVKESPYLDKVIVATEDDTIFKYCESENIPVIMTSTDCLTGTDRVVEVSKMQNYDFYVNIQGDEPVIEHGVIAQLIEQYAQYGSQYIAYNLYKVISDKVEINSKSIIKVIVNEKDELLYMSRLPIPYSNSVCKSVYKQQVPVYGFTKEALNVFGNQAKTLNEQFEDVELLRFIDLGFKLKMTETFANSISVDVPSDVAKVENFLRKNS